MASSGGRTGWRKAQEATFLATLRQTGNVTAATAKAGLDRAQAYRRRNLDSKFREAWQGAMDEALDILEACLWEKAMGRDPVKDPQGRDIDEKLAIFLLKAHRPEIFGDGKRRLRDRPLNRTSSPRKRLMAKLDGMAQNTPDDG